MATPTSTISVYYFSTICVYYFSTIHVYYFRTICVYYFSTIRLSENSVSVYSILLLVYHTQMVTPGVARHLGVAEKGHIQIFLFCFQLLRHIPYEGLISNFVFGSNPLIFLRNSIQNFELFSPNQS